MIEAVLNGSVGSWSASAVLAGLGNAIDRLSDRSAPADQGASGGASTGPAASFELALAEEILRAGDVDVLDIGFNGALLSKSGEIQRAGGQNDRFEPGLSVRPDAADDSIAASGPYRRVGFDDGDASARLSAGDGDRLAKDVGEADRPAFWIGDRVVDHSAFRSNGSSFVEDPEMAAMPMGRVLFNGDGRPIIPPSVDAGGDTKPLADDGLAGKGDLMILPDGAIIAYEPWIASADGERVSQYQPA